MSIATLLSQHHHVTAVDIIPEKVEMINNRKSPIQDDYIEKYLAEKDLDLTATLDAKAAYSNADFVVIAAPTNYDSHTQHFDTSAVEAVIKLVMEYTRRCIRRWNGWANESTESTGCFCQDGKEGEGCSSKCTLYYCWKRKPRR